jgi:hypothetical protein
LTFDQVLRLLEPKGDGVFYRHPKLPPWNKPHDKEWGFSRDQMTPLVAAMGVWGKTAEIRRLWDALPEDFLGKHSFNGDWRNFLGQDGRNCSLIKERGCDATADCSLKTDNRDCSLKTDNRDCSLAADKRDCSLKTDNRDCSLQVDTRSCGRDIGPIHYSDLGCELAKGAQNVAYKAVHDKCEFDKANQNAGYKVEHDGCETGKAGQNVAYKAVHDKCEFDKTNQNAGYKVEHDGCEAGKGAQNVAYKAEHDACEMAKTTSKMSCEAQKGADSAVCMVTNVHSGDVIGPMTVNLFRRAMGESPLLPVSKLRLPATNFGGFAGEAELGINVGIRMAAASKDRDDTGDDLNLIVMILMSRLRFPSPASEAAATVYSTRPFSYGSYLGPYRAQWGDDMTDYKNRMEAGIGGGWRPDAFGPYGAVRWYHRQDTGGNPQLAELYQEILEKLIKPPLAK